MAWLSHYELDASSLLLLLQISRFCEIPKKIAKCLVLNGLKNRERKRKREERRFRKEGTFSATILEAHGHVRINQHLHCNTRRGNHYDCGGRSQSLTLIARLAQKTQCVSLRVRVCMCRVKLLSFHRVVIFAGARLPTWSLREFQV